MLHVNRLDGLTIAVRENRYITQVARRTILSDDALSVLVPVLEDLLGWNSAKMRLFFESHGFALREWDKMRTDTISLVANRPRNGACSDIGRGNERDAAGISPGWLARSAQAEPPRASGVMAAFLVHGLVVSTWVSRIAHVKGALHLGDGTLGLACWARPSVP